MRSPFVHLVFALLVALATVTAYSIWYGIVSAKSDSVASIQSQIDGQVATVGRLSTARTTLTGLAQDEAAVRDYFVPETGVASFIDGLQNIGRTLGSAVQVSSVSSGGTTVQPNLSFALTVSGTFDEVMRTIGAIEYAPYDITVTNLSVQNGGKGAWQANIALVVGARPGPSGTATTTP